MITVPESCYSNEAEQQLLGALLVKPKRIPDALDRLDADCFFDELHQLVFKRMRVLITEGKQVNPITICEGIPVAVTERVAQYQEGGLIRYLMLLASSLINLETEPYIDVLRELRERRTLWAAFQEGNASLDDRELPASQIRETCYLTLLDDERSHRTTRLIDLLDVREEDMRELESTPAETYRTGYAVLDKCLVGGLHCGRAYAITARMKAGKTMMLGAIAFHLGLAGVQTVFICSEASAREIERRNWARQAKTNAQVFMDRERLTSDVANRLVITQDQGPKCVTYADLYSPTLDKLKALTYTALLRKKPKVLIYDYLQLVDGRERNESDAKHLDRVAQWFANLAHEQGIAVLIAAQLNQEGNIRGSEGLKLAFDQVYRLERERDQESSTGYGPGMWMDLIATRYSGGSYGCGNKSAPAFKLNTEVGPYFEEVDYG